MSVPSRLRPWLATVALLLIGLGATAGSAIGLQSSAQRDEDRRFDAAAERARGAIATRLQLQIEGLTHLRNWMLLHPDASREDFEQVTSLGFADGLYPRVQALAYGPLVPAADKEAFEAGQRLALADKPDHPPFAIHPMTDTDAYPITYIVPTAGNEAALGFDLASEPTRRAAVVAARDRGHSVGTAPVRLIQEPGDQVGFVLFAPVYDTGEVPVTAPARRRHIVGVLGAVLRVGDMLSGVLGTRPEVDVEIYDIGATIDTPDLGLDRSTLLLDTRPTAAASSGGTNDGMHRSLDLSVADRRWRLVLTPSAGFGTANEQLALAVGLLGTLVTLLLAGMVHRSGSAREHAEQRASE